MHLGARRRHGRLRAGSSPHARGAHRCRPRVQRQPGLIPACAGSTPRLPALRRLGTAHPRMRGEHWVAVNHHIRCRGSSPHARGALVDPRAGHLGLGLIPACAGSTPPTGRTPGTPRAHPRMRGEHCCCGTRSSLAGGSSPHARGAHVLVGQGDVLEGLIPACAGSTRTCARSRSSTRAHPRMRGEHRPVPNPLVNQGGSSPHARGAPRRR
ncbi:Domain of uncharacterised function (DUF2825) [Mycobacteroides abscessus subsp. abscessus]|nr:Domain of uncharacterised function (DUF2825) [Mycobacteroides abscessus subsp. abscessus]